jgi:hypothetical protein
MSWIKDNKFIVALGGGTLVGAILLYVLGSKGAARYEEAMERFGAASSEASSFESLALYPRPENRDGKRKALDEYRQSLVSLQNAFEPFRPKEIKNITPQEFTSRLLAANSEVSKAFGDSGTKMPEAFFLGFEGYKTSLASPNHTGILDYQLASIKNLMLALAEAKPTELKNLYRPTLAEEEGLAYNPGDASPARPFPLEITFTAPEKSVREFLTRITKSEGQYVVVRVPRISNEKKDPPRASDAKFDKPAATAAPTAADVFSNDFVLPGEEAVAESDEGAKPDAPVAKPNDSSRILSQVLGNEELHVFLRLDVLQFLPAKKLP